MQAHSLSTTAARTEPVFPFPSLAEGPGLAHDAGNLLGALVLYSDLLRVPGVLQPQHQHYATELRDLSERSSILIRRLLDCSTSRTPGSVTEGIFPPVSAARTPSGLRELQPILERIAAPDAVLTLRVDPALPGLPFAAESLERIVINLVRNASEALRRQRNPRGCIEVTLSAGAGALRLTVADNGPGLDPITAARFVSPDMGERVSTASRGLGHRIIHDLVAATRGTLSLHVRPRFGATFTITWEAPGSPVQLPQPGQGTGHAW